MEKPKVSVLCLTYNQEKFLRQALDSIVYQKTDFDFEIIIHDDASTDGTIKIIKEFESRYPNIVRSVLQKENQYSKGIRGILMKFILPLAKGEYIAVCEGDDFFTDNKKIQLQADFLDKNPNFSICFHPVRVFFENKEKDEYIFPDVNDNFKFTIEELLKSNFIQTNSVMYRRQNYDNLPKSNISPSDWYLHLYHAKFGKIGFINKVMSAYRRHVNGIWWNSYKNPDEIMKKHGTSHLSMHFELLKIYSENRKYRDIILKSINGLIGRLAEIDRKDGTKLLEKSLREYPKEIAHFFINYLYDSSNGCMQLLNQEIQEKNQEIQVMKSSKFSRARSIYIRLKNKIIFIIFNPRKFVKKYFKI